MDGGLLSFFRGNGLNALKIVPESALKFYVFEHAKSYLAKVTNREKSDLGLGSRLLAGGCAGLVSQFAIYPIELVKTRRMSQIFNTAKTTGTDSITKAAATLFAKEYSLQNSIRNLWKEGGIRSFYRGVTPALIGIIPYAGVDLAVFETLKDAYAKLNPDDTRMPILIMLGSGMFSGSCGAILMYPLALVRTRYSKNSMLIIECKHKEHHHILRFIRIWQIAFVKRTKKKE